MSSSLPKVSIHTDGGCLGNPGIGGWAAVLQSGRHRKELSGGEPASTNNRMELTAAMEALKTLKQPCLVTIHTDSQYLRNGITKWLFNWKRNQWRTAAKQPVKNADLWQALDAAASRHQITWHWVKGHAGVHENERCDQLAKAAMQHIKSRFSREHLAAALQRFKTIQIED